MIVTTGLRQLAPKLALVLCLTVGAFATIDARAQSGSGYATTEDNHAAANTAADANGDLPQDAGASAPAASTENAGPVRLARFGFIRGNVTWRSDESGEWAQATTNLPIRQGAQVWVTEGGRAEVQFDDGSVLRLGAGALVTLKVLYSDADGEFTQLIQNDGLATLYARHDHSVYQIDTPLVSVKTTGPSRIRFGVGGGVEVAVQNGSAAVEGKQGKSSLERGDYLDLADENSQYSVNAVPGGDAWDQWNDQRDRLLEGDLPVNEHCPPNIALVAGDLDTYGVWHEDPAYGSVWCPRSVAVGWRPYHDGHWTWVEPFGWTWVSSEAWGWAPYHYGSWVYEPYGWAWVPGPVTQFWCPAVVSFSCYNGSVCWAPLCPRECRYPAALEIGFRVGRWPLFFSIGQAGCYYPGGATFCVARGYNNFYVNRVTRITNITNVTNIYNSYSTTYARAATTAHFVPVNAAQHSGGSRATLAGFAGGGAYEPLARTDTVAFTHGQTFAAPPAGRSPLAGPVGAAPTIRATTPLRTVLQGVNPPRQSLTRQVYHTPLPTSVRQALPASERTPASQPNYPANRTGGNQLPRNGGSFGTRQGTTPGGDSAAAAAARARQSLGYPSTGGRTPAGGNTPSFEDRTNRGGNQPPNTDRTYRGGNQQPGGDRTGNQGPNGNPRYNPGSSPGQSQSPGRQPSTNGGSPGGYRVNQEPPHRTPAAPPSSGNSGGNRGNNNPSGQNDKKGNGH